MKAICNRVQLTDADFQAGGVDPRVKSKYLLTVGSEYLVLGVSLLFRPNAFGDSVIFDVVDDAGRLCPVPSRLFSVCDKRVSRYWQLSVRSDSELLLWPEEFLVEYFHDDLSDGSPAAQQAFQEVLRRMNDEFHKVNP